ncbi:hypothetical protein H113_08292, partial [Trichophyton rubrum MR1459]
PATQKEGLHEGSKDGDTPTQRTGLPPSAGPYVRSAKQRTKGSLYRSLKSLFVSLDRVRLKSLVRLRQLKIIFIIFLLAGPGALCLAVAPPGMIITTDPRDGGRQRNTFNSSLQGLVPLFFARLKEPPRYIVSSSSSSSSVGGGTLLSSRWLRNHPPSPPPSGRLAKGLTHGEAQK